MFFLNSSKQFKLKIDLISVRQSSQPRMTLNGPDFLSLIYQKTWKKLYDLTLPS